MPPNANVEALQVVQGLTYHNIYDHTHSTPVTGNTRLLTNDSIDVNSTHSSLRVEEGNHDCHQNSGDRNIWACYYHRINENKASLQRLLPKRKKTGMPRQIRFSSPNPTGTIPREASSDPIPIQPRTSSNSTDKVGEEKFEIVCGEESEKEVEAVPKGRPLHHLEDNDATSLRPNCPPLLCESEKGEVEHRHRGSGAKFCQTKSAPNLARIACFSRKKLRSSESNSDIRNDIFIINYHHLNKQIVAQQNLTLHSSAAFQRKRRRWRRRMVKEGFKYLVARMIPPQLKGQKRKTYNLEPSCGRLT